MHQLPRLSCWRCCCYITVVWNRWGIHLKISEFCTSKKKKEKLTSDPNKIFFDVLSWSLERDLGRTSSYRDLQNTYGTPEVQGQLIVSLYLTKTVMPPRAETSYANNCPTNNCSYNSSDKLCVYRDARSILLSSVNNSHTTFFAIQSRTQPNSSMTFDWLETTYQNIPCGQRMLFSKTTLSP